jgi:hypothetical protein
VGNATTEIVLVRRPIPRRGNPVIAWLLTFPYCLLPAR